MPDAHKNFAYSTVATAPSPDTSGTLLVVQTGDGTKFPTPPFNATVWPAGDQPLTINAEIVRVTAISGDTLTIVRAQESTTARSIVAADQIAATITVKTFSDVENADAVRVRKTATQSLPNGVETPVTYDTEDFDTSDMHDNAVNNSRLISKTGGKYMVVAGIDFAINLTGNRSTRLRKNGTTIIGSQQAGASQAAGDPILQAIAIVHLEVGDYVEQLAFQNSGGALNIEMADTSFSMVRVGR